MKKRWVASILAGVLTLNMLSPVGTLYVHAEETGSTESTEGTETPGDTDTSGDTETPEGTETPECVHELKLTEAKEPTCAKEGNKEYYACSLCEVYFEDAEATVVIEDKTSVVVPATEEHNYGEWVIDSPATLTQSGKKHRQCTNEECTAIEEEDISAGEGVVVNVNNAASFTDKEWEVFFERLAAAACWKNESFAENEPVPAEMAIWFLRFNNDFEAYPTEGTYWMLKFDQVISLVDKYFANYDADKIREWLNKNTDSYQITYDSEKDTYGFMMEYGHGYRFELNSIDKVENDFVLRGKANLDGELFRNVHFLISQDEGTYKVSACEDCIHNCGEWIMTSTEHWKKCTVCGTEVDKAEHEFEKDQCKVCKYIRAHVHELDVVEATEATCTKEGNVAYYTCSGCEEWFEDENGENAIEDKKSVVVGKKDHAYGEWETVTEATCTEEGSKVKTCVDCGDKATESIKVKEHPWAEKYTVDKAATCTEKGSKSIHCTACTATKDTTEIEATGHSYGDWETVTEATCTEEGSRKKTCSSCKDVVEEAVEAKGHSWAEEYTVDKAATCTEKGSKSIHCTACTATKDTTEIEATGHSFGEWETNVEETCTENGNQIRTCSVCKAVENKTIPALGHDNEGWTSDGTYHFHLCKRCEEQSGHEYHTYVKDICTVCGYETEHVHDMQQVKMVKPTCTEEGTKEYYICKACEKWYLDTEGTEEFTDKAVLVIAPLGHEFKTYKSRGDATCTADGTKIATCERCTERDVQPDPGSMLPHDYDKLWMNDESGHWHECYDCKAKSEVEAHEYIKDTCKVCEFERDHVHAPVLVTAVEPTCVEPGNVVYYTCSGCSAWFEDDAAAKVITDKTAVVVAPLDHSFTIYVSNNDAECEKNGTKTAKCDRCDVTNTITDEGSALGHEYGEDRNCVRCGQKNPVKLETEISFTEAGKKVVYNGDVATVTEEVVTATEGSGDIAFTYYTDAECMNPTYKGQQKAGKPSSLPGRYYVKATVSGNEDYNKATTEVAYVLEIAPKAMTAMSGKITSSGIKLTWDKSREADGYIIYRRAYGTDASAYEEIAVIDNNNTLEFVDKDYVKGERYYYSIAAYADAEDGTKVVGARVKTAVQAVWVDITKITNYKDYVKITWKKAEKADKYEVWRKVSGKDDEYKLVATIKGGSNSYNDEDSKALVNGRASYYKIKVKYNNSSKVVGESISKKNYFLTRRTISSLTATKTTMKVKWDKNKSATGYEITYSTSSSFTNAKKVTVKDNATVSKTIKSLSKNKKYYVKVRAYTVKDDVKYYSLWSAYKTVKTKK